MLSRSFGLARENVRRDRPREEGDRDYSSPRRGVKTRADPHQVVHRHDGIPYESPAARNHRKMVGGGGGSESGGHEGEEEEEMAGSRQAWVG